MKAEEARVLSKQCEDYNAGRDYDRIKSKIVVACGDGAYYLIMASNDVGPDVVKRLLVDGYNIEIVEAVNIIVISWK